MNRLKALLRKLTNLSIKARLVGVLGLLCLMLIIGAVLGLGTMSWQKEGLRRSYQEAMVPAQLMGQLRAKALLNFTVLGEATGKIGHPDQVQQKIDKSKKIHEEVEQIIARLQTIPMSEEIAKDFKSFVDSEASYTDKIKSLYDALNDGYKDSRAMLDMQLRPPLMMRLYTLNKLIKAQSDQVAGIYKHQSERYESIRLLVIASLLLGLIVAAAAAIFLARSLIGALRQLSDVTQAIAEGHLGHDIKIRQKDELGRLLEAFQVMDERLTRTVSRVRHGSEAVSSAAQQIARGNAGLSERTQEEASSLVETSSSMEEMTSTVKQTAENARHANQLAHGAHERARQGGEIVDKAVLAMGEIDASSGKISDIVGLIQDIAFQTNLLALNAAVEAARAGEQGRGFAVVAGEVRNLAQRSDNAAREIKGLIAESEEKVKVGSDLVNQSGQALAEILESVKNVTDIVNEISTAAQEQSVGIDQVNNAVANIEEMTQQNSTLVQEASTAARSMQEEARELARQVSFFTIHDAADAGSREPSALSPDMTDIREAVREASHKKEPSTDTTPAKVPDDGDNDQWDEF